MAELLRFATCGSVDDGKSTLIGRLLYDSKQILADQLQHVEDVSQRRGDGSLDLALLTDGLRAEREQGITIDVAYRAFATARRRFIIADCPGHEQYTRNMVTGSSTADLSIVLIDARNGVVAQSRRHASIASLLRIPHLVVCVNKMDLVDWDESAFDAVVAQFAEVAQRLEIPDVTFIAISARLGDNVVERSERMPWYDGPTLLTHLEEVEIASEQSLAPARFPVQWVIRPQDADHPDYRGYAGRVAGGSLARGDDVVILPSGRSSRVAGIDTLDGDLDRASAPMSVTVLLEDDIDVARGDMIVTGEELPLVTSQLRARICWMAQSPLRVGDRYVIKHTTRSVRAVVDGVEDRLDIETLRPDQSAEELLLNDIGAVSLRLSGPLVVDPYSSNRETGSFILIDESSNDTVAAGMILG
ncbi:MAG: GTP-binding protein [Actinomycetota bacterium]